MEILELLDEFEQVIEDCSRIPMTGKVIIHEDILYKYLDQLRAILPDAVQEAQWILKEKERVLKEAEAEGESIIEAAKSKIQRMSSESEIYKMAKTQGDEIIDNAKNVGREITHGALTYADDVMSKLQAELEKTLQVVKQGREEIRQNVRS
ncbi:MAG: ATPase [Peptococcia bacterium]